MEYDAHGQMTRQHLKVYGPRVKTQTIDFDVQYDEQGRLKAYNYIDRWRMTRATLLYDCEGIEPTVPLDMQP